MDVRLARTIAFGERRSASIFAELFNATNATNLTAYVATDFWRGSASLDRIV